MLVVEQNDVIEALSVGEPSGWVKFAGSNDRLNVPVVSFANPMTGGWVITVK